MQQAINALALLALSVIGLWAEGPISVNRRYHQAADQDGVYYTGPEVTAPRMVRTVGVPYPNETPEKNLRGMTVLAMIIDANGIPEDIQILHRHGDSFDQAAIAAVKQSKFEPGKLGTRPVPVWIDVRVVFRASRQQAIPQVLITERDLPPPDNSQLEDKHHNPLPYTPPFLMHTVDADFDDPFVKNPYIQVAVVSVHVSEQGLPREVRVARGLGFGLDEKAVAAVERYRFFPAMKRGKPVAALCDVKVNFAKF